MKSLAVIAVSVLTLVGSVTAAEARGFRLRGSGISLPHGSMSEHGATTRRVPAIAAVGAIGPRDPGQADPSLVTRSVMTADAQGADETAPIPPMPPAPAPLRKAAEPWCPSGRIAGAGAGFCLIN